MTILQYILFFLMQQLSFGKLFLKRKINKFLEYTFRNTIHISQIISEKSRTVSLTFQKLEFWKITGVRKAIDGPFIIVVCCLIV